MCKAVYSDYYDTKILSRRSLSDFAIGHSIFNTFPNLLDPYQLAVIT